jgi:hypothetical protein
VGERGHGVAGQAWRDGRASAGGRRGARCAADTGDVAHGGRGRRGARRTLEMRRAADAGDEARGGR